MDLLSRACWCLALGLTIICLINVHIVVYVVLVVLLLFAGIIIRLLQHGYEQINSLHECRSYPDQVSQGLNFPLNSKLSVDDSECKFTGSSVIDPCLNEILQYILRDNVDSWYSTFTNDQNFSKSLRKTAYKTVSKFTKCLQKVDWVSFLTRNVVDDFASHIRLYRRSRERCLREQRMTSSSSLSTVNNTVPQSVQQQYEQKQQPQSDVKEQNLETYFFDYELEMEKSYCRDSVSTSSHYEYVYMHDIATILLYLLLPAEEFNCRPSMLLLRTIFVKKVLVPLFDRLSEPDFIYQTIAWLLMDVPLRSEDFLAVLEKSQDIHELCATQEAVKYEISLLRSKDTGGKDDAAIKQQLSSLFYVHRLVASAIKRLKGDCLTDQENVLFRFTDLAVVEHVFSNLSLDFVLSNSIAINYFMDFLTKSDNDSYIGLYLSLASFRSTLDEYAKVSASEASGRKELMYNMRHMALNIYDLYLSDKAINKIDLDHHTVQRVHENIENNDDMNSWFVELFDKLLDVLQNDPRFFVAFQQSETYLKLLTELKLIASSEEINSPLFNVEGDEAYLAEDALDSISVRSGGSSGGSYTEVKYGLCDSIAEYSAVIDTVALGNEGFALYNIVANKNNQNGEIVATWNVVRRYSDFYALHNIIQQKFPTLRILSFPSKKAFNNLSKDLWERRKKTLNNYLKILLLPSTIHQNKGLEVVLLDFLCSKDYCSDKSTIANRLSNFVVNPIKLGVRSFGNAVISVPDVLVDNVARVSDNLGKVTKSMLGVVSLDSLNNNEEDSDILSPEGRVGAQLDNAESSSNIPIRILLLFMDEVFGLRKRNQWFRRRLVVLLHHFIHAAFGTSINRKIIDYVHWLMSEQQVAEYLKAFKNSIWPNGTLAEPVPPRSQAVRMRTRVVAKCKMLAVVPDELQLFIGNETTLDGVSLVFDALQNPRLNRRFCYVLLERLLLTIFPHNKFEELLPRLHSKSPRCSAMNLNKS